jgi:hypothetical protein
VEAVVGHFVHERVLHSGCAVGSAGAGAECEESSKGVHSRSGVDSILAPLGKVVGLLYLVRPFALRDPYHPQELVDVVPISSALSLLLLKADDSP